jgi:hypothetical protein
MATFLKRLFKKKEESLSPSQEQSIKERQQQTLQQLNEIMRGLSSVELVTFYRRYLEENAEFARFLSIVFRAIYIERGHEGLNAIITVCERTKRDTTSPAEQHEKWKGYDDFS